MLGGFKGGARGLSPIEAWPDFGRRTAEGGLDMVQTLLMQAAANRTFAEKPRALIRAIGRWSLVALVVNSIIGSGVFGLPSTVAALIGNYSPYAVLAAGAGMSVIIGCFAEVASRFQEAGGPYLYARVAFGRLTGIQTAWMLWLGQVAAPAANANLFVIYLGEFFPHAKDPLPRAIIVTALVGLLTFINIRGVRAGTQVSNLFTAAKLVPLFAVIVLG